ncbi:helix-turn-helix domain-containing protein [Actinocrispum wychmicini]|uniref:Helix-turn-helix protein n=1 Tax=Actinocrispum wychmicini TaxID=1213861 RepID=A0A4R2ITU6_9PSEU|nr:helix-turn-helix transcriptional regulator [Actinocrispum wychmicini]TCO47992.1 helix-turn-helix protein [Actinocrispum wychmicini]
MEENRPTAAERELGALIKAARGRAGLTLRALASEAGFRAFSRISEIENAKGKTPPSVDEVRRMLDALNVDDLDERERALGLAAQASEAPGQLNVGPAVINETLVQLIDHERAARRITMAGPLLIPGLLQTTDYARRIVGDSAEAEPRVALRAGRRDILTRRDPVELSALIDSEALIRPIVPPDQMVDQLRHILDMASLPNVTVQVVMSTTPGYHPMLSGQFELLEFVTAAPIVLVDHYDSSVFLRDPAQVDEFAKAAEYLRSEIAMSPEESSRLIAEIANGMEST